MATSTNAELLSLSGLRNPYPGKLGVVEEDALADLLLVDGNPVENSISLETPQKFQSHYERREDLQERRELTCHFGKLWRKTDLYRQASLRAWMVTRLCG